MSEYKIVNAEQLDNDLSAVANAIKEKLGYDINASTNFPSYQFPQEFIDAISGIESGGGGSDMDSQQLKGILEGTITELNSNTTRMREYAAGYCADLTKATLPYVKTLIKYAFRDCTSLHTVDLGLASSSERIVINANSFNGASAFETLIIRTNAIAGLQGVTAFTGTLIANGSGHIYVPSALVDSYKAATNWSTLAEQIFAIEDYPEITGGAV